MVREGRGCSNMPCESCAVQFSVFRRKRACSECERYYCGGCLRRGGGFMCAPCRVLSTRPLLRHAITHLKVRDLQCFLQRQNVSTRGCVEKEELVNLCVSHVNSAAYRRRGPRAGAFSTLKGLTNNINDFLNSAFDIRMPQDEPHSRSSCFNSTHVHVHTQHRPAPTPTSATAPPPAPSTNITINITDRRFTPTPGGERDVRPEPPEPSAPTAPSAPPEPPLAERSAGTGLMRSDSAGSARVDTADCYEIEDLDDAGWEFVTTPADPLPNDSEVLLATPEGNQQTFIAAAAAEIASSDGTQESEVTCTQRAPRGSDVTCSQHVTHGSEDACSRSGRQGPGTRLGAAVATTPQRAASEMELHRPSSADTDTASLQDEPLMDRGSDPGQPICLERLNEAGLDALSVRQLKELLRRNRVEFRGCLERADLLQRARTLCKNNAQLQQDIDSLPIEECCKICMAAPLECVLLECGHIAACTACSKQLAECPICRQYVVRAVRFFRS